MFADNTVATTNKEIILRFVKRRSTPLFEYICKSDDKSNFSLWYKVLTHSDLTTRGKRTNSADNFDRNLLYYLSTAEMENLQKKFPNKVFESAKQSNIGMPEEFYRSIGIERIQRRKGKQLANHNWIRLNDSIDVQLVCDSAKFFNLEYTARVLSSLGKEMPSKWRNGEVRYQNGQSFVPIELHQAIHGLGVQDDKLFHYLRLSMFLNDSIIFLAEENAEERRLFVLLEKNPLFFSVLNMKTEDWIREERLYRYKERLMIKEEYYAEPSEDLYENEWESRMLP